MRIQTDRFGTLDLEDNDAIQFPEGLIGFAGETEFVLLRHAENSPIGWLQSTKSTWLALPVVSVEALAFDFDPSTLDLEGVSVETHAVMTVLNTSSPIGPTVNMLAPVVVNVETRTGRQTVCIGSEWSPYTPFILRGAEEDTKAAQGHEGTNAGLAAMAAVAASP